MREKRYLDPAQNASSIAARLGLHRAGRGWRGTCPACGYAGALALDEHEGRPLLWCASCGDRAVMARLLRNAGALPPARPERLPRLDRADPDARRRRALALWDGAMPIAPSCPAALYLARRRIGHAAGSPALRWRSDVPHPSGGRRIALIARIDGPDGALQGVQRIYLDRDGNKADCEPVKASLGIVAGGAVRSQTCSTELAIAEGIESAASAGAILGLPAWSAISAGNLARSMILPAEIRNVTIAADADEPGLRAAEAALRRWRAEGRTVRIVKAAIYGRDFNDLATDRTAGGDQ